MEENTKIETRKITRKERTEKIKVTFRTVTHAPELSS